METLVQKNKAVYDSIYVVHALHGYEYHEKRVRELFKKTNLDFEFIADGDPSFFTPELLDKYFIPDITSKLKRGTLSCVLNHIMVYERMVKNNNHLSIVFEDDPFFIRDFNQGIARMADEIRGLEKSFIISLENSSLRFPSVWDTRRGKYLYPAWRGRMAGAYMIDYDGALNILNHLKTHKCDNVVDWWHNSLIAMGVVKMYWAHPPLVEQGSLNGNMHATNSVKSKSMVRRVKWKIQKAYKYTFRRLFKQMRILS